MARLPLLGIAVTAIICCLALQTSADNSTPFISQSGAWQVRVDSSLGNGCFFVGSYPDGSILRVGLDMLQNGGYIFLYNDAWKSLTNGTSYEIALSFDGQGPSAWRGVGKAVGSIVGIDMHFFNSKIWDMIAQASNITFYYRGVRLTSLNLVGTSAAVAALVNCQKMYPGILGDPFAGSGGGNTGDPFKN